MDNKSQNIILKVKDLSVSFDDNEILSNINFEVSKGNTVAVIGPNGAGKSTLFRALLDLVPYDGEVNWLPGLRIGYVPQRLAIEKGFPLTVRDFLMLKTNNKQQIRSGLMEVGFITNHAHEHHLERHIMSKSLSLLSGGEFQRVLVAWALLGNPQVLLFDEPTAGIDIGGEETIYNLLKRLQADRHLTTILISHDLNVVYQYADNVMCLNKQQICYGIPSNVLDPKSLQKLYGGEAKFYQHKHRKSDI